MADRPEDERALRYADPFGSWLCRMFGKNVLFGSRAWSITFKRFWRWGFRSFCRVTGRIVCGSPTSIHERQRWEKRCRSLAINLVVLDVLSLVLFWIAIKML